MDCVSGFFLGKLMIMMFETIEVPLNIRGKRIVSPLSSLMRPGDRVPKPTREDEANVFFDLLHPVSIPGRGNAMAFFGRLFYPPFMMEKRTDDSCAKQLLLMLSSPPSTLSKGDKIVCAEWVDFFFVRRLSLVGVSCPKDFLSRFPPMEWDMKFSQLIDNPRSFVGVVTDSDIKRILTTFSGTSFSDTPPEEPAANVFSLPSSENNETPNKIIIMNTPEQRDALIKDMMKLGSRVVFITRYSVSSMSTKLATGAVVLTFSKFLQSTTLRDVIGDGLRSVTILLEDPTEPIIERASTMRGCEVIILKTLPSEIASNVSEHHGKEMVNSIKIVSSVDKIPQQNPDDLRTRRVIVGGHYHYPRKISSLRPGECGMLVHRGDSPWFISEGGVETKIITEVPFINGEVILPHHAHGRSFNVPVIVDRDIKILPFMSSSVGIFREDR